MSAFDADRACARIATDVAAKLRWAPRDVTAGRDGAPLLPTLSRQRASPAWQILIRYRQPRLGPWWRYEHETRSLRSAWRAGGRYPG